MTAQRLVVLRAVAGGRIKADAVAEAVKTRSCHLGPVVYDALGLLVSEGLIRRIQPSGSPARFEDRVGDNHHHLICRLRPRGRRRLRDWLRAVSHAGDDWGYEIDEAEVAYWGRCPDCLGQSRAASPPTGRRPHAQSAAERTAKPPTDPAHGQQAFAEYNRRARRPVEANVTWTTYRSARSEQSAQRPVQPGMVAGSVEPERPAHEPPGRRPDGRGFDYAKEFLSLDLDAVKKDIEAVMTDSQDWWPADFGHYGGLFIRMAWHSAGTYRIHDGRGGAVRVNPLSPLQLAGQRQHRQGATAALAVKQKYGRKLSWADLIVLTGNVALESMGFKTFGFAGGRKDVWEPEHVNWGSEATWLGDERYSGDRQLANPFGAVQMGLIYVNPEGPNGKPDPVAAARDIRETFRRMAMNDYETVALIAGGHSFGKTHGAAPATHVGREPEGGNLEEQGFGWKGGYETGTGAHAITSGLEVTWTTTPDQMEQRLLQAPVRVRVGADRESGWREAVAAEERRRCGHRSARPRPVQEDRAVDADHGPRPSVRSGLREDLAPLLREPAGVRRRLRESVVQADPPRHGPITRYLGPEVPKEPQIWQDPVPPVTHELIDAKDIASLKEKILASGLSVSQLASTAWASASSFRGTDKRGGANGARIVSRRRRIGPSTILRSWRRC